MENPASSLLINKGIEILKSPYRPLVITKDPIIDRYLNDLDNYPHFFVLACIMDRQMKAESAWKIPYLISKEIGSPSFNAFESLSLDEILEIFAHNNLHRFKNIMAVYFYNAVQRISIDYGGYASRIWRDDLSAITIMSRFLKFDGAGLKIASMATNILIREFKLPIKDKSHIDVSPDVHVRRVFLRLGFIEKNSTNDALIYSARSLYPDYPGVFDLPAWEVGRNWCKPNNPDCKKCYLNSYCQNQIKQGNNRTLRKEPQRMPTLQDSDLSVTTDSETRLHEIHRSEIENSVIDFRNRIHAQMTFNGTRTFSFPGGESEDGDNFRIETSYGTLTITIVPDTGKYNRYLHFVNLNHPESNVASDIEINIPKVPDKRVGVTLAKKRDHRFMCNRGKCTVYMGSLKKADVLKHFDSEYANVENILDDTGTSPVIVFADLDSKDFFEQLARFTNQMMKFKAQFRP